MDITEEKVRRTASWLRMVVWGAATNPASKPVITAMADATERRDWASLRVLGEALRGLEDLTCGIDNGDVRNIGARALTFAAQALDAHE